MYIYILNIRRSWKTVKHFWAQRLKWRLNTHTHAQCTEVGAWRIQILMTLSFLTWWVKTYLKVVTHCIFCCGNSQFKSNRNRIKLLSWNKMISCDVARTSRNCVWRRQIWIRDRRNYWARSSSSFWRTLERSSEQMLFLNDEIITVHLLHMQKNNSLR